MSPFGQHSIFNVQLENKMQYFCTVKNCGLDALDELDAARLFRSSYFGSPGPGISLRRVDSVGMVRRDNFTALL